MSDRKILLKDIWPFENVSDYKVHFARWSNYDEFHPLDRWVYDPCEWKGWQQYRPAKKRIQPTFYLFAHGLLPRAGLLGCSAGYFAFSPVMKTATKLNLMEIGKNFIGRLKVGSSYNSRATRGVNFENHYETFEILEILREPYSGQPFPGYGIYRSRLHEPRNPSPKKSNRLEIGIRECVRCLSDHRHEHRQTIYRISLWRTGRLVQMDGVRRLRPWRGHRTPDVGEIGFELCSGKLPICVAGT